ncbi:MAG: hypothetical protein M3N50_03670 [Pseudomonadota bacterium]|nr:hypothetical protein [Pseudomonadota bacterium]
MPSVDQAAITRSPRGTAAGVLQTTAQTIHHKADSLPGGQTVSNAAHCAADTLGSTADYVREHDVRGMMQDVTRLVKNNPGPVLLCVAAMGFLVARRFSND